jgi:hypothetical protein
MAGFTMKFSGRIFCRALLGLLSVPAEEISLPSTRSSASSFFALKKDIKKATGFWMGLGISTMSWSENKIV